MPKRFSVYKILVGFMLAALLAGCSDDSGSKKPHKTEPLLSVLDSANMMYVTPVGLGKHVKPVVISGRLYENFVQMLRTAKAEESLQDTFKTQCATGVEVKLFRDTLSIAELRIAENIGRIGNDIGTWVPKNPVTMAKVNTFIKSNGLNFKPCAAADSGDAPMGIEKIIHVGDTAIGTPLYSMVKDANRITVRFAKIVTKREQLGSLKPNVTELDPGQVQKFLSMLRESSEESFGGHCLCLPDAVIKFYRDSTAILNLNAVGKDFRRFEKVQLQSEFGKGGFWEPADPRAFSDYIRSLRPVEE